MYKKHDAVWCDAWPFYQAEKKGCIFVWNKFSFWVHRLLCCRKMKYLYIYSHWQTYIWMGVAIIWLLKSENTSEQLKRETEGEWLTLLSNKDIIKQKKNNYHGSKMTVLYISKCTSALTNNNQVLYSCSFQDRIKVCCKESAKSTLHQLIFPLFDNKPISQLRSFQTFHCWTLSPRVMVPAEKFNVSSRRVMLSDNLHSSSAYINVSEDNNERV